MNRRELLGTSFALAAATQPWSLSAQTLERFEAGATPTEGDSLIFLAQSEGYFGRAGLALDVQRMSTGETSAAALASGDIAIGGMNTMSLAIAHQNGIELRAVAGGVMYLSTHSGSQMMVAKSSSANSGRDLVGKVFAVNVLHGSAQLSSQAWIDKHGGDSTSVHWIEMPFSVMEAALVAGRIDAALIAQPFATTALATCRSLGAPNDAIAPRFLNSCYVATPAWISTHHDEAVRIRSALSKAAHWYNTDPAGSVAAVAELTKQDPAVVAKSVRSIFGETIEPALLQPVIDVGARYSLLKRSFPASEIIAQL
ncbi:MAG TPA: ABC transporter substrate-binding protein [Candidatus Lustribacter sp.]|nr:ABC transporter substrate-binding protein [Candidatus Lustribacter sp.]